MIKLPFWSKEEKFLVLEVTPKQTQGILLSIDLDKKIKFEKFWKNFSIKNPSKKLRRNLGKWKIIIAADPALAFTTMVPVHMDRDEDLQKIPISKIEIENLLSAATAKIFNHCRREAGEILKIDELDAVLIDNRVNSFKVDGHKVINPVEFKAKRVDAVIELTFTRREIFEEWRNFFSIGLKRNFFFTELSRAELSVLGKIRNLPINLIALKPEGSHYFSLESVKTGNNIKRGEIKWKVCSLLEDIILSWGVDVKIARNVYRAYLNGDLSPEITKFFSKIFKRNVGNFFDLALKTGLKGPIHIETCLELPFKLPKKRGKMIFQEPSIEAVLDKLGFRIKKEEWPWPENKIFQHLAPFLDFYYNSKDIPINHWLRRRLHWLGTNS